MLNRILVTTDAVGGVWRYSIELAREFAARNIEVVLAILGPAPGPAQRQEAATMRGLRLMPTALPLDWLADTPDQVEHSAHMLAAIARQVGADSVQLHAPALVGHACWPMPVVAVAHSCVGTWWRAVRGGPLPSDLAWRAEATRAGIERADNVVAPSASFAAALGVCYGAERSIDIIFNGRTPMDGRSERKRQALVVGRLWDEGKNIAALDAAAGMLSWPVLAAGPAIGPNGAAIHGRHLRMLGALDDAALAVEYATASVFVSPAHYEPFGLAVLEAAQAGCALVLSDIPTFRELWDGTAVFVRGDAPEQIAAAIEDLLDHPAICKSMGARAARRAVAFNVRQMSGAIWAIHDKATTRPREAA